MTIRTSKRTVTFGHPFTLKGVDEVLPAGVYTVETEEAPLETMSFLAWRRVSTLLHLHANPGSAVVARVLTIDPTELDATLKRDRARATPSSNGDAPEKKSATKQRQASADRQAIERGEDEGMIIHPTRACPRRGTRKCAASDYPAASRRKFTEPGGFAALKKGLSHAIQEQ